MGTTTPRRANYRSRGGACWIGASLVAMGFAALGFLPPLAGAILREGIDVGVILNALRARTG